MDHAESTRPNSAAGSDRFSSDDEREVMSRQTTHGEGLPEGQQGSNEDQLQSDQVKFIVREEPTNWPQMTSLYKLYSIIMYIFVFNKISLSVQPGFSKSTSY